MDTTEQRRRLRWADWPILALAGLSGLLVLLVIIYTTTKPAPQSGAQSRADMFSALGRGVDDVTLINDDGATVRWADLNGKPRLLFFGFTRCPEVCPTTVFEISAALDELGVDHADVSVAFVSVDPARDTPEHLAAYFQSFGPLFTGYSGEQAEIDRLVRAFQAFYEYVPTSEGDYTVNHTAITFLINPAGDVVDIIGYGNPHDRRLAQLRALLR
ncbi:MAG TPA: SCO family protein [Terricaulis sp.]|nr:SCO family protein [Terricaulis sp.]